MLSKVLIRSMLDTSTQDLPLRYQAIPKNTDCWVSLEWCDIQFGQKLRLKEIKVIDMGYHLDITKIGPTTRLLKDICLAYCNVYLRILRNPLLASIVVQQLIADLLFRNFGFSHIVNLS
jgi:hypothetical protein